MLSNDILATLKQYTADMEHAVTFVLQEGEHDKKQELSDFLTSFVSVSDKLAIAKTNQPLLLKSPVSFALEVNGASTGIVFSGIPGGHEFSSLVLAVLQAGGKALKLDQSIQSILKQVSQELHFEVYISLSCHNCPDVVQALNQFALLNPMISTEMIDGGLFPDLIEKNDIQGVPSVYLNGEIFANGKVDTAQLIAKLTKKFPELLNTDQQLNTLPLQDVAVIGGGPAGVAAAVYAARKGLAVTIIADRFGGQVKDTMGIENLISVASTTGPKLTGDLISHLNEYEVTKKEHIRVNKIENGDIKTLHLSSGEIIQTKTIIVATGANWRELGVPGEKENIGNGVAYCPHCDGPFYKGKDVAVIGGGNSGVEAALDLAGIVKSVTVFEFLPELKADKVLVNQLNKRANVSVIKNVATKQILAQGGKVNAIEYTDRATNEVKQLALQGVFVQIGLVPNSKVVSDVVDMTKYGEIRVNEKGQTSETGIFACGDVTTVPYKQIVIAMGEGAKAALTAYDYLLMQGSGENAALSLAS